MYSNKWHSQRCFSRTQNYYEIKNSKQKIFGKKAHKFKNVIYQTQYFKIPTNFKPKHDVKQKK